MAIGLADDKYFIRSSCRGNSSRYTAYTVWHWLVCYMRFQSDHNWLTQVGQSQWIKPALSAQVFKAFPMKPCLVFFIVASTGILLSCNRPHSKNEIISASGKYDHFIQEMQVDSIVQLYSPNGSLGDIAEGRDSIKSFLLKFKDIKVLSQLSITDSVIITSDSALQTGKYRQTAVLPTRDTVAVTGRFVANWKWLEGDGWHIQKMTTIPTN